MTYFGQPEAPNTSRRSAEGTSTERATSWRDEAACKDADQDLFFPDHGKDAAEAKVYCDRCPVRGACLKHAFDFGETHGIWGGLSAKERKALFRGLQHLCTCEVCGSAFMGRRGQRVCQSLVCRREFNKRSHVRAAQRNRNGGAA